jgi:hypothetical protein
MRVLLDGIWDIRNKYPLPNRDGRNSDTAMEHMHHHQPEPISKKKKLIKSPTKKMQQN